MFQGVIEGTNDGTFFIERAHKYFPRHSNELNTTNRGFHSVIYHESEVTVPKGAEGLGKLHNARPSRDPADHEGGGGCGMDEDVSAWMESIQNSGIDRPPSPDDEDDYSEDAEDDDDIDLDNEEKDQLLLSRTKRWAADELHHLSPLERFRHLYADVAKQQKSHKRKRRGAIRAVGDDNRGTCVLSIQTDPMLWEHIKQRVSFSTYNIHILILSLGHIYNPILIP